jgi:hypothetical protein
VPLHSISTWVGLSIAMINRLDESTKSNSLRIYLVLLWGAVLWWLWWSASALVEVAKSEFLDLLGITALYVCSHVLRMLRLVLLTLDKRNSAVHLVAAHALTAFPCSFIPFKLGEVLRLAAFLSVFESRQKAIAVWLAERFGDVLVIGGFILGLYLLNIYVPPGMRIIFIIFVLLGVVGLVGLFAVAKVFVYLNRHLVLTSLSVRGLLLLRASHALRSLETSIHSSLEGRLSGFLLLSVLIWAFEIFAMSLFMKLLSTGMPEFTELFVSGLLASLPSGSQGAFGFYQTIALVGLTLFFLLAGWVVVRFKNTRN